MKKPDASEWAMFVVAVPLGGLGGAIAGSLIGLLFVSVVGGNIDGVMGGGLLGGLGGLIGGPLLVARRWREREPF